VRRTTAAHPVVLDRSHPAFVAAAAAYRAGFGAPPVMLRSGGTIPVVHTFQTVLRVPTVLMGFGLPTDRAHGPNEHMRLDNLFRGIVASREFLRAIRSIAEQG
jgi:acetylornithine deacetylase/succinyl-diaminopimelate desuccinylase-like protein